MTFPTSPYLPTSIFLPEDKNELLIRLTSYLTEVSLKLNQRTIARFDNTELATGEIWFNTKPSFRRSFQFGAIAAGATLNIPHGITGITQLVRIFGGIITDAPDFRGLPFVSEAVVTDQVSAKVVGVNIVIINGATAPNITSGNITIEYLKN